jgi:outer membrane protein assembly factor BamB
MAKGTQLFFKIILSIILIYVCSSIRLASVRADDCNLNADFFNVIDTWDVNNNTIPVQLLWQKSEPRTRPPVHLGSSNTGFIASEDTVLYWQPTGVLPCDEVPIVVGFDAQTGIEKWRYRALDGIITKAFLVEDGFILLNTSSLTKLDQSGVVVWHQDKRDLLPFRAFTTMYEINDSIFFPELFGAIYEISSITGDFIRILDYSNVMGFWGNYALFKVSENELQLRALDSGSSILYTLQLSSSIFQNTPLNPIFPFVKRYEDILFLFYEGSRVEAYDFFTGRLLWESDMPLYGSPAFVGDSLIMYRLDQTLEIHEPDTGHTVAAFELRRDSENGSTNTDTLSAFSIWITGNNDTVFIRQIDELELVALKLDLSSIN